MIKIIEATSKDISIIQDIAYKTWPDTYGSILSKSQLDYMLQMMYSDKSLLEQINRNVLFFLAYEEDICLGFASSENNYQNKNVTRLHKLYVLPEAQGKQIGKLLIDKVIAIAKENKSEVVSLNVNKFNKAYTFYLKMGFEIVAEEDLEIGHGYLMEDYKMEKRL